MRSIVSLKKSNIGSTFSNEVRKLPRFVPNGDKNILMLLSALSTLDGTQP